MSSEYGWPILFRCHRKNAESTSQMIHHPNTLVMELQTWVQEDWKSNEVNACNLANRNWIRDIWSVTEWHVLEERYHLTFFKWTRLIIHISVCSEFFDHLISFYNYPIAKNPKENRICGSYEKFILTWPLTQYLVGPTVSLPDCQYGLGLFATVGGVAMSAA